MILVGSGAYLFYSGNAWDTDNYAIGYAVCESVTGPCRRPKSDDERPWMSSTTFARGPGGQEFFGALGDVWMVYHGWESGQAGKPGAQRRLYLDIVRIERGRPVRVGSQQAANVLFLVLGAIGAVVAGLVAAVFGLRRRRRLLAGGSTADP